MRQVLTFSPHSERLVRVASEEWGRVDRCPSALALRVPNVIDLAISLSRSQPSQRFFPTRDNFRIVHVSGARFALTLLIPVPDTAIRHAKQMVRLTCATGTALAALQFPACLQQNSRVSS